MNETLQYFIDNSWYSFNNIILILLFILFALFVFRKHLCEIVSNIDSSPEYPTDKPVQHIFTSQELLLIKECLASSINHCTEDRMEQKLDLISKCEHLLENKDYIY